MRAWNRLIANRQSLALAAKDAQDAKDNFAVPVHRVRIHRRDAGRALRSLASFASLAVQSLTLTIVKMRSGQCNRTQKGLRLQCPSARATGQPVSGDRREYGLNVLRQDHRSSGKHRPGTGGGEKQETGTRREPAARARIRAAADIATCGREQRLHVVEQRRRNVHGNGLALPFKQCRRIGERRQACDLRATIAAGE